MRRSAIALTSLVATVATAAADSGAVVVIPGRPDVPIIINGVDASWAVVEGDWGLARSVHVQPTVYGGRAFDPEPRVGRYFPSAGHLPGYGRREIEPPPDRRPARRAEGFHQSWSAGSAPPTEKVALDSPAVALDPRAVALDPPAVALDPPAVALDPHAVALDPPTVIAAPAGDPLPQQNFPNRPVRKYRN